MNEDRRFKVARIAVAAALLVLLVPGPADAGRLDQTAQIKANEYLAIALYPPGDSDWRVDAQWTSNYGIDGWVLTKEDYLHYTLGEPTSPLAAAFGSSGRIVYDVPLARNKEAPFYLILDNTADGRLAPAWWEGSANVTLVGETLATNTILGVHPGSAGGILLFVVFPLLVLLALAARYARRRGGLRISMTHTPSAPAPGAPAQVAAASTTAAAPGASASSAPAASGGGTVCSRCGATATGAYCPSCGNKIG